MATYKYPAGTVSFIKTIEVDEAFVSNSFVEAELVQPADTIIEEIKIVVIEGPTVTADAGADLGYKVGTDTSTTIADGADDIVEDADGIIDAAASTGALATGFVQSIFAASAATGGSTAVPAKATSQTANVGYTASERTLFLNTLATTETAITSGDGGKIRWVVTFTSLK